MGSMDTRPVLVVERSTIVSDDAFRSMVAAGPVDFRLSLEFFESEGFFELDDLSELDDLFDPDDFSESNDLCGWLLPEVPRRLASIADSLLEAAMPREEVGRRFSFDDQEPSKLLGE